MGTFILTFVGRSLTLWLQEAARLRSLIKSSTLRRKIVVIAYFVTIAAILTVFGVLTIPYIVREGADFVSRLQAENIWCGMHVGCLSRGPTVPLEAWAARASRL